MSQLAPNEIISEKYLLIEKLSEGGGGIVWRAKSVSDDSSNEIALKTLKWSPLAKSKELTADRFKQEFELFKKVSHPNIAKIYDFGFDIKHGIYFFTSELLLGGDLRQMIRAPIPVIEILFLQSLRTLEYLRNFGILHLDIKPQNLLLHNRWDKTQTKPQLSLIDFGLAALNPPDKPGGTPNYMPPEIVLRRLKLIGPLADAKAEEKSLLNELDGDLSSYAEPNYRSDLYSLGVTFYFILAGVLPFAVQDQEGRFDVQKTMRKHLKRGDIPPPSYYNPKVPTYLDAIIMRMISQNPNHRYQSALFVAQALCFRSPNNLEAESHETINAYLPEDGLLIGRQSQIKVLRDAIETASSGMSKITPGFCIAGKNGTGKTRLLDALIPLAQQMEMEVNTTLRSKTIDFTKPHAFLIDDPISIVNTDTSKLSDLITLKNIISSIRKLPKAKCFIAFTVNTDLVELKKIYEFLEIDTTSCKVIDLENFTIEELSEYVTYLLGEKPSIKIIRELHNATYGNPKLIADLFKHIIKQGEFFSIFSGRPTSDTLNSLKFSVAHIASPPSLDEYLLKQIEDLPQGAKTFIYKLACWHRPSDINELEAAGDDETNESDVTAAIASGIVRSSQNAFFSFSNPLTSKIIKKHLDPKLRASYHDHIAKYLKDKLSSSTIDSSSSASALSSSTNNLSSSASALSSSGLTRGSKKTKLDYQINSSNEIAPISDFEIDRHLAFGSDINEKSSAAKRFAITALEKLHPAATDEILEDLYLTFPKKEWEPRKDILIRQGQALARLGRHKEAWDKYELLKSLTNDKKIQFDLDIRANELQAFIAIRQRDLGQAEEILNNTIKKIGYENSFQKLRLENFIAGIKLRQGNADIAFKIFTKTAILAKELNIENRKRVTNNELGETLLALGKIDDAIKQIKKDLLWAKEINHIERTVNQKRLLGNAFRLKKDYNVALTNYREALDLARKYYLFEHQLRIQTSLANVLLQIGKWKEAIKEYMSALDLAMRLEGKATAVEIMANVALAYNNLRQFDDAIEYLELALDFTKSSEAKGSNKIKKSIPAINVYLGHAYYEKHMLNESEKHLLVALNQKEIPLSDITLYNLHGTLTEIDLARHEGKKAKQRLSTLKKIAKKIPEAKNHLKDLTKKIEEEIKRS